MSHFVVTVAVPFDRDPDAVVAAVAQALDPYDENKEVEPYGTETVEEITGTDLYQRWIAEHPDYDQETALRHWLGKDAEFDAQGRLLSTYNPQSKWDWWQVGGRWADEWLTLKDGTTVNVAIIEELAPESIKAPFAYVDLDGSWHEKGEMGWFGATRNEADEEVWTKEYLEWIQGLGKDITLVVVDCHI